MRVYLCTLYGLMIASIRRRFPTKIWFDFVLYACVCDTTKTSVSSAPGVSFLWCMCVYTVCMSALCVCVCIRSCLLYVRMRWLYYEHNMKFCVPELHHPYRMDDRANVFGMLFARQYTTQTSLSVKIFHLNSMFFCGFVFGQMLHKHNIDQQQFKQYFVDS